MMGLYQSNGRGDSARGSLSPLLSNIMLDDFDKELEKERAAVC
jgi:retron-type reverse transcriptase